MNTSRPLKKEAESPSEPVRVLNSPECLANVEAGPREPVRPRTNPFASDAPIEREPVSVLKSDT